MDTEDRGHGLAADKALGAVWLGLSAEVRFGVPFFTELRCRPWPDARCAKPIAWWGMTAGEPVKTGEGTSIGEWVLEGAFDRVQRQQDFLFPAEDFKQNFDPVAGGGERDDLGLRSRENALDQAHLFARA